MAISTETSQGKSRISGIIFGASSYLIWGISPIYWKTLKAIPALEIIAHRIVWSCLFLIPLILLMGNGKEFVRAFKTRKTFLILMGTSVIVGVNWLIYVWAINTNHLLQASLGYYINPLVNVLLGVLFLKERLRKAQVAAVLIAAAGVLYLTVQYGDFPWIALSLAFTFGIYGLIRKVAPVGALPGLTVEALMLTLPGIVYLVRLESAGTGAFTHAGLAVDLLLIGASVVTTVPLLFFALGARRLNLSTMGFLQYIAPTMMFLLGVFVYREPFSTAQLVTFGMIWTALFIYSADSVTALKT